MIFQYVSLEHTENWKT